MWVRSLIGWGFIILWISSCALSFNLGTTSPSMETAWDDDIYDVDVEDAGLYRDGIYRGVNPLPTPQFIVVDVSIEKSRIVAIHLRQHPSWSAPQEQDQLLQTVIDFQTTSTVEPRDEGSEQDHLLDAIEDALSKARQAPSAVP